MLKETCPRYSFCTKRGLRPALLNQQGLAGSRGNGRMSALSARRSGDYFISNRASINSCSEKSGGYAKGVSGGDNGAGGNRTSATFSFFDK